EHMSAARLGQSQAGAARGTNASGHPVALWSARYARRAMQGRVDVLGVQMDLGAGVRGVDMGPSAVRYAGLIERLGALGLDVRDRGNIVAPVPQSLGPGRGRLRYAAEIAACCGEIARKVAAIYAAGATPLLL